MLERQVLFNILLIQYLNKFELVPLSAQRLHKSRLIPYLVQPIISLQIKIILRILLLLRLIRALCFSLQLLIRYQKFFIVPLPIISVH